jgi:hypothetical protein
MGFGRLLSPKQQLLQVLQRRQTHLSIVRLRRQLNVPEQLGPAAGEIFCEKIKFYKFLNNY